MKLINSIQFKLMKEIYYSKFLNNTYQVLKAIDLSLYKYFIGPSKYPKIQKLLSRLHIVNLLNTARELATTNKSMGRCGDAEMSRLIGARTGLNSFEKNSSWLSKHLLKVINSNYDNYMVAIPDAFRSINPLTDTAKIFWMRYLIKNSKKILPNFNLNKTYYSTDVTRPYTEYDFRKYSTKTFKYLKEIWNHKNVLIIEGNECRLGYKDDLLDNTNNIRRIECPSSEAINYINNIYNSAIDFLQKHKKDHYITLISLGATATLLSYKIFKYGYRALDVGNIDIEYNWYTLGTKGKVNLPYKYVNEVVGGHSALPINSKKFKNEIIKTIG